MTNRGLVRCLAVAVAIWAALLVPELILVTTSVTTTSLPVRVITGLGDSVMTGANCDCDGPIPELAAAEQSQSRIHVDYKVLGVNGSGSSDLLNSVVYDHELRQRLAKTDLVVIMTGANDFCDAEETFENTNKCDTDCTQPLLDALGNNLTSIVVEIKKLRQNQPTTILLSGYWNIFVDGAAAIAQGGDAFLAWSTHVTFLVNEKIKSVARTQGVDFVDVDAEFRAQGGDIDQLLAEDGDHPDGKGVRVLVQAFEYTLGTLRNKKQ